MKNRGKYTCGYSDDWLAISRMRTLGDIDKERSEGSGTPTFADLNKIIKPEISPITRIHYKSQDSISVRPSDSDLSKSIWQVKYYGQRVSFFYIRQWLI